MFIVIAREDTVNGQPGRYSQCTRKEFTSYKEAYDYACGVSMSRGPYVLELPENGFGTCGVIHTVFGALYKDAPEHRDCDL